MISDSSSHAAIKGNAYLVAPRRRRHRGWFHRRRSSKRGRFEIALLGGGGIALLLAGALPGLTSGTAMLMLALAGLAMTVVARMVGIAPSLAAAVFAPLVIALTDPMWALGATINDFTLAEQSEAVFAVFVLAAILGSVLRHWHLRGSHQPAPPLWSATPQRLTPRSDQSVHDEQ